jgi:hypothetical protein
VCRWGVLRRALPATMSLRKITALVMCLCKLHNFCTDIRVSRNVGVAQRAPKSSRIAGDVAPKPLAADELEITTNGGIPLIGGPNNDYSPEQLLDGGNHHSDTTPAFRRQFSRRGLAAFVQLPREKMRDHVESGGYQRPKPARWDYKNKGSVNY